MNWRPIDWGTLGDRPPVEPTLGGLVYPGRRHVFSGPPESAKTWVAFCLALEEVRAGGVVAHLDFEMYAYETRDRLRLMGATDDELLRFRHIEPETPADDSRIGELVEGEGVTLALIDAAAGAFDLQGLDDNARRDAETFARTMIEPFRSRGVTSVLIDHVVKNSDNRGRFTIGSERKTGAADVHLGFTAVVPFGRGRTGLIKVTTHKDRFGFLPRPCAAEVVLRSDPATFAVSWEFGQSSQDEADQFRPTVLMERVSSYLNDCGEPASRNDIEKNVSGRAQYVRQAVDCLIADGYANEDAGPRGSKLVSLLRPFTSSDLVPTSSRTNSTTSSLVPPSKGDEDEVGIVELGVMSLDEVARLVA